MKDYKPDIYGKLRMKHFRQPLKSETISAITVTFKTIQENWTNMIRQVKEIRIRRDEIKLLLFIDDDHLNATLMKSKDKLI